MVNPKIIKETPISLADINVELEKIKKRDKEIGSRALKMEDYINQFLTLSAEDYKKVIDELKKLDIPRLRDNHIIKIVDLIPRTIDDLKVILQGYTLTVNDDNMKKIVAVTAKFAPKQK